MLDQVVMLLIAIILSICATISMFISNKLKSDGWGLVFFILEIFAIIFAIFALVQPHFVLVAY